MNKPTLEELESRVALAIEACRDEKGLSDGACRFAVLSILAPPEITPEEQQRIIETARRIEAEIES